MRMTVSLLLLAACASGDPSPTPTPDHPAATNPPGSGSGAKPVVDPAYYPPAPRPKETGQSGMIQDQTPGNTGVDEHGNLLRQKPDPDAPKADPKLVADDDANMLYFAAGLAGDQVLLKKAFVQLGIFDASGAATPKFQVFLASNQEWIQKHADKLSSINMPATAKAYLTAHLK